MADSRDRRRRQQQDNDQGADGEPDHGDSVENPRSDSHHCGHGDHRGQNCSPILVQEREGDAFEQTGLGNHRNEEREPQQKQHGIGMHQVVEPMERQEVVPDPVLPTVLCDLDMPLGRGQTAEGRPDDQEHAVGEGILV